LPSCEWLYIYGAKVSIASSIPISTALSVTSSSISESWSLSVDTQDFIALFSSTGTGFQAVGELFSSFEIEPESGVHSTTPSSL
jgi:hypothetical protein